MSTCNNSSVLTLVVNGIGTMVEKQLPDRSVFQLVSAILNFHERHSCKEARLSGIIRTDDFCDGIAVIRSTCVSVDVTFATPIEVNEATSINAFVDTDWEGYRIEPEEEPLYHDLTWVEPVNEDDGELLVEKGIIKLPSQENYCPYCGEEV